jgi:hypothetical protein
MVRRKTIWVADIDGEEEEFASKKEATEAEDKFRRKEEKREALELIDKYFPFHHKDTCRSRKYCVGCGSLLLEFDTYYDGHRNELTGSIGYAVPSMSFLEGLRCPECHKKAILKFNKMVKHFEQIHNTMVIIDPDLYKTIKDRDLESLKNIYNIIDTWDKMRYNTA